jgi:hypothetical protein
LTAFTIGSDSSQVALGSKDVSAESSGQKLSSAEGLQTSSAKSSQESSDIKIPHKAAEVAESSGTKVAEPPANPPNPPHPPVITRRESMVSSSFDENLFHIFN